MLLIGRRRSLEDAGVDGGCFGSCPVAVAAANGVALYVLIVACVNGLHRTSSIPCRLAEL